MVFFKGACGDMQWWTTKNADCSKFLVTTAWFLTYRLRLGLADMLDEHSDDKKQEGDTIPYWLCGFQEQQ